jgi:elongation factor G
LCAFAFKTIHEKQLGPLTFVRVFGGNIVTGQKIYNVSRSKGEKLLRIYLPLANDFKETEKLSAGQVAVISGLKVKPHV